MAKKKVEIRMRRKRSIRKKVAGTAERPRLTVFRSARHIYAQVIDDVAGKSLAAASSLGKTAASEFAKLAKKEAAKKVGEAVAKRCLEAGITKVVFDRNGFGYHGRVAALADGAREAGLRF
ncbi:MAG: 50S ribosomal protein L18 [Deltaproteobacteria bacterium]|nr:50S ribosomal protein L18 [Deltaproteobacteria bacterium]